jgi:hypothetical protein
MMMWEIPLRAPGYPFAQCADQCRFNDALPVKVVVIIGLIESRKDPSSQFRDHGYFNKIIFEIDDIISLVLFFSEEHIRHGIGIDPALGTLGVPSVIEPGIGIRVTSLVGRNYNFFLPDLNI